MNLNSLYMSEENQTPLITCIIPSQQWSMVVAVSCSGGVFQRQGLRKWWEKMESWMQLNTEISLIKTWFRALRTLDWAESSHFNMTITLRPQPRLCRSGLGTTLWMSSTGPARAETWNQSDIFGETCKWLSTDGPQSTWQSLRLSKLSDVIKFLNYTAKSKTVTRLKQLILYYFLKLLYCILYRITIIQNNIYVLLVFVVL